MRGGSWTIALLVNTIVLAIIYGIWVFGSNAEGFRNKSAAFVPPPKKTKIGWAVEKKFYEYPRLVRPADCETKLYAGSPT